MVPCPMVKYLNQFWGYIPFSQSCFKIQMVWQYLGQGKKKGGGGNQVWVCFFHNVICWVILSSVFLQSKFLDFCWAVSYSQAQVFYGSYKHLQRDQTHLLPSWGVTKSNGGVGGDLWSQVRKNCFLTGKLILAPLIISTSLGPLSTPPLIGQLTIPQSNVKCRQVPVQQIKILLAPDPSYMEILEILWLVPLLKLARFHRVLCKMQTTVNFPEASCPMFI